MWIHLNQELLGEANTSHELENRLLYFMAAI